jgi:hypothetical protein
MRKLLEIDHEDVLEHRHILLWSSQIRWVKENKISLSSLLRTILQKEIWRRDEEKVGMKL